MKKTKETKHRPVIAVVALILLTPMIALTLLAAIMPISAQTDFTQAAENTLRNGAFMAAFSGNVLAPAYEDVTQMPAVSRAEVVAVVADALEREQLSNAAAVVQTISTRVDSQVQGENVTYSITLPVSTFLDCGVDSAERLAAYTVERVGTANALKPLAIVTSPNPSVTADELVTIKLPVAITVLIFDRKSDGEKKTQPITTSQNKITISQDATTTSQDKTTSHNVTTCESTKAEGTIKRQEKTTRRHDTTQAQEKTTRMHEADNSPKTGEKNFVDRCN